jgi:transposase
MNNKKIKKINSVSNRTMVVGVDIGKYKHVAIPRLPDGKELKEICFYNTGHSFKRFVNIVTKLKKKFNCSNLIVAMEPTGPYWEPLAYFLDKRGITVVEVNPMHTKRYKDIENNTPEKADKKDARVIAELVSQGKYLELVIPYGVYSNLRKLSKVREQEVRRLTALKNQIRMHLDHIFPEMSHMFKDIQGATARYLIENYPTPSDILKLGFDRLKDVIKRVSNGRLRPLVAETLFEHAKESAAITEGIDSQIMCLKQKIKLMQVVMGFISEIDNRIYHYLLKVPYSDRLLSMPNIGVVTLGIILGETGGFRNYSNCHELIKLSGLNLYTVSSGTKKGQNRITKMGRPLLRKALYMASCRMVKIGQPFHQYYNRLISKGTLKIKALIAVCRKIIRVLFALFRKDELFSLEALYS